MTTEKIHGFEQVCDAQVLDDILLFLVPMNTVDCFREIHRTLAPVNKYFYDKIQNNKMYWQIAYDLTFKPAKAPMFSNHIGPVKKTIECGLQNVTFPGYIYDPETFSCRRGYLIQYYGYHGLYYTGPRCKNVDHYQLPSRNKSRFKDLFKRTARRYVRKNTKKRNVMYGILRDLNNNKKILAEQQTKVDRLQKKYNLAKMAERCAGLY